MNYSTWAVYFQITGLEEWATTQVSDNVCMSSVYLRVFLPAQLCGWQLDTLVWITCGWPVQYWSLWTLRERVHLHQVSENTTPGVTMGLW